MADANSKDLTLRCPFLLLSNPITLDIECALDQSVRVAIPEHVGMKLPSPKRFQALFEKDNDCQGYDNNRVNNQIEEPCHNNITRIKESRWGHRITEHDLHLPAQ